MSNVLVKKTLKGLSWSYISVFSMAGSQILIGGIMARLLNPSDFGLIAISNLVLKFGQYFSKQGIASAIIQKKNFSKKDEQTCHTIGVLIGLLISFICFFIAPLLKSILNDPNLIPVLKALSFTFVLSGFGVVSDGLLRKQMKFKFLGLTDLISYFISYSIGIILAFLDYGVWALVYAILIQQALRTLFSYSAVRHSVVPVINVISFKKILSYGSRSSIIGFIEFLYGSMDSFFIGKYLGASSLGFYNRAKTVVDLPIYYTGSNLTKVIFPLFSELDNQENKELVRKVFIETLSLISMILVPLACLVSLSAELIISVLLGNKWMEAIIIARIIPFSSVFGLTASIFGVYFDSRGTKHLKLKLRIMIILLLLMLAFFLAFINSNSLTLYTLVVCLGSLCLLLVNAYWVGKALSITLKNYVNILFKSILISVPLIVICYILTSTFLFFEITPFLCLPIIWFVCFFVSVLWVFSGPFNDMRNIFWDRVGQFVYPHIHVELIKKLFCRKKIV